MKEERKKCEKCGKKFSPVKIKIGEKYDRGDGVMVGSDTYSHHPVCPHCGQNNSPKAYL